MSGPILFVVYVVICFQMFSSFLFLVLTAFSLFVFSLQFRLFGSEQVPGQGIPGLLHPCGHSLRRTRTWGKKFSCTTQILTGCLYSSCFTHPVELNWLNAGRDIKSLTVKCHKQQLWHYVKRGFLEAILGKACHSVIINPIIYIIEMKRQNLFITMNFKEMDI